MGTEGDKKGENVAGADELKAATDELKKAEKELKGGAGGGDKLSADELLVKAAKDAEDELKKGADELKLSADELLVKAAKDAEDELKKGADDLEFSGDEALIEASEAYAALEKSVDDGMGSLDTKFELLQKSVTSLTGLCIAQSKVIAALSKSVKGISDADGGKPVVRSKTELGLGGDELKDLKKSLSEARELLEKAVEDETVDPRYLGIFGVHGISGLPEDIQKKIGL